MLQNQIQVVITFLLKLSSTLTRTRFSHPKQFRLFLSKESKKIFQVQVSASINQSRIFEILFLGPPYQSLSMIVQWN